MDVYNKDLCEEKHLTIKEDINHINQRLDGHDIEIADIKDANTKSHFELREAINEIKNCVKLLTDNQTNRTEITKGKLALYGIIVTGIFSTITAITVAFIK